MKRMGAYAKAAAGVSSEEGGDTAVHGRCAAYGCPLSGANSNSTLGGGPWYCRYHIGGSVADNDATTTDIRQMIAAGELDRHGYPIGAKTTPVVEQMRARLRGTPKPTEEVL